MMDFDILALVPKFILNDKDGYAMAKALEAGLKDFLAVCEQGLDTWGNVDTMPEWRLDEMAWEYNCPYDYTAELETKRQWIREALVINRLYGTPEAINRILSGYAVYGGGWVEEWFQYGGQPYHFRVFTTDAELMQKKYKEFTRILGMVKNVRSVLDNIVYSGATGYAKMAIGTRAVGVRAQHMGLARNYDMNG